MNTAVPQMKRVTPTGTPDRGDFLAVWRNVRQAFNELFDRVPLLNGQLLDREVSSSGQPLDGIALSATAKAIGHGLGRPPRGWFVVRSFGANAAALRETARDARTLTLVAASPCTVYLWVWG